MRRSLLVTAITTLGCGRQAQVSTPATPRPITSADQLLSAMRDRYAGKWYRNLTFIQKSTFLRPDGTTSRVEPWYEAGAMPRSEEHTSELQPPWNLVCR